MTTLMRFRRYLRYLRSAATQLRHYECVHHVDIGFRYRDDMRTAALAARLFIAGPKRPRSQHKAHALAPRIHRESGMPIDVIHFRPRRHIAREPLVGGLSIGSRDGGSVTLGAVVRSGSYVGLQALTSDEVGRSGDIVYSPCAGRPGAQRIGTVNPPSFHNASALVALDDVDAMLNGIQGLPGLTSIVDADELDRLCVACATVAKSGAATGVTSGIIDGREDTSGTVSISSPDDRVLAGDGDCGSIWTAVGGGAVAIHYGGDDGRALAQAMYRVRDALAVRIP